MRQALIHGWCPGARRPMARLDGLLMRLRLAGGILSSQALSVLADGIEAVGGKGVELSQRGNLQICGLSEAGWQHMLARLAPLGVVDGHEQAEAMRNILCSPLAGLDCLAARDIRPAASALTLALTELSAHYRLPAKFSWIVEDGGSLSLADIEADMRFLAVAEGWRLGVARTGGVAWFAGSDAPAAMAYRWVPVLACCGSGQRMRDVSATILAALTDSLCAITGVQQPEARIMPGLHRAGGVDFLSVGAPFGRVTIAGLQLLARLALERGNGEVRFTPWRQILLPGVSHLPQEVDWRGAGLSIAEEPLLSYFACRGSGFCSQALAPVRSLARKLAAFDPLPGKKVHISGCAKGCACPGATDIVLVAQPEGFGLIQGGCAKDRPARIVPLETILQPDFWKDIARNG